MEPYFGGAAGRPRCSFKSLSASADKQTPLTPSTHCTNATCRCARSKFARELAAQQRSVADIARLVGVSRATVYRMLADEISPPPPDVANDGEPSTDEAPLEAVGR